MTREQLLKLLEGNMADMKEGLKWISAISRRRDELERMLTGLDEQGGSSDTTAKALMKEYAIAEDECRHAGDVLRFAVEDRRLVAQKLADMIRSLPGYEGDTEFFTVDGRVFSLLGNEIKEHSHVNLS